MDTNAVLTLSIIIPVLNEESNIVKCIKSIFKKAYIMKNIEIIVVDGRSRDATTSLVLMMDERITGHSCATPGRAKQMNYGARQATHDVLLFLHADSIVPDRFDQKIMTFLNNNKNMVGGTFKSTLNGNHWFYFLSDFYTNEWSASPHGSSGLFVRKTHFNQHPFNDATMMEIYDYFKYKMKPSQWRTLDAYMLVNDNNYKSKYAPNNKSNKSNNKSNNNATSDNQPTNTLQYDSHLMTRANQASLGKALGYYYSSNVDKIKYSLFG